MRPGCFVVARTAVTSGHPHQFLLSQSQRFESRVSPFQCGTHAWFQVLVVHPCRERVEQNRLKGSCQLWRGMSCVALSTLSLRGRTLIHWASWVFQLSVMKWLQGAVAGTACVRPCNANSPGFLH